MDLFEPQNSYQSQSGFRIWGGTPRPVNEVSPLRWLSLAFIVGIAVALGTWYAALR
jgi:hypothetical protein